MSNLESNFSWQVVFNFTKNLKIHWIHENWMEDTCFLFSLQKTCPIPMFFFSNTFQNLWETAPPARFYMMLGQIHLNGWSRVIASQNGDSTDYIFPLKLGVLQWNCHLFNYWKNKKTIIERFLILLIWNWIYIDHRKITWLWS